MAVLESFLVHARSLMTFLYPARRHRQSDVGQREFYADDFCPPAVRAKAWKGLGDERDGISKDLMHLSIDRLEVGRSWPYGRMLQDLRAGMSDFLAHADHRLSDHLKREIAGVLAGKRIATADTAPSGADSVSFAGGPTAGGSVPTTTTMSFDELGRGHTGPAG